MGKKVEKTKKANMLKNIIIVAISVILVIFILINASNYIKEDTEGMLNLIINNRNVTLRLKKDIYINEKDVIYLSQEDIANFFDKYIYYEEEKNLIITTYDKKIAELSIDNNNIKINGATVKILSGAIIRNDTIYLPISELNTVYNIEVSYHKESQIITFDSLDREQEKADVSKKLSVKYKPTIFSKTVDKIEKAEKVILIETKDGWAKVRTSKGIIGYIKESKIKNIVTVRETMKPEEQEEKINLVWDYYSEYVTAPNRNGTTINGINVVSPSFFSLVRSGEGEINDNVGEEGKEYINWAKSNNYKVWAMVSNNSYKETTNEILNNYELRQGLIENIVTLAVRYDLDGINIDFENMYKEDKDLFSRFIIELAPRLKECGMTLSVDVTAPDGSDTWSLCYDRNVIGDVADYIIFMAYDQYGNGSNKAGTTAGYNWVENNIKKFLEQEDVDSNKLILGLPMYTRLWREDSNGDVTSSVVNMRNVNNVIPSDVEKVWDEDLKQYYVEYEEDGYTYKMWIEDENSIKEKVGLVSKYGLAGVASWEKDRESDNIWSIINEELNK